MALTRAVSQFSWVAARQGKVHFTMMQDGNEASSVGSAMALGKGVDFILPYARDLGAVMAMGMTTREVMLNLLGKAEDPNGGGRNLPLPLWLTPPGDCQSGQPSGPTGTYCGGHSAGLQAAE